MDNHGINTTISDPQKVVRPSKRCGEYRRFCRGRYTNHLVAGQCIRDIVIQSPGPGKTMSSGFGRFRQSVLSVLLVEDDHNCEQPGILFLKKNSKGACFEFADYQTVGMLLWNILQNMHYFRDESVIAPNIYDMRHFLSSHNSCGKPGFVSFGKSPSGNESQGKPS